MNQRFCVCVSQEKLFSNPWSILWFSAYVTHYVDSCPMLTVDKRVALCWQWARGHAQCWHRESNPRPSDPKSDVLLTEPTSPLFASNRTPKAQLPFFADPFPNKVIVRFPSIQFNVPRAKFHFYATVVRKGTIKSQVIGTRSHTFINQLLIGVYIIDNKRTGWVISGSE